MRFAAVYQYMFKSSSTSTIKLLDVESFGSAVLPHPVCLLVSGSLDFVERYKSTFLACPDLIWIAEQPVRDLSYRAHNKHLKRLSNFSASSNLKSVSFLHRRYGGATNASHLVSFGSSFHRWLSTFSHPVNVVRTVAHHWNSASRGSSVRAPSAPLSNQYVSDVVSYEDGLLVHGLLHVRSPRSFFFGPSVFYPGCAVRRRLTIPEILRVYDIPMSIDGILTDQVGCLDPRLALPFEASISPAILASLFRSLWSCKGGVDAVDAVSEQEDDDVSLDSIDDAVSEQESDEGEVIITGPCDDGWNYDSDNDSLMPGPPLSNKTKGNCPVEWDSLEDESTVCLDLSDETASLTSFGDESFAGDLSSVCSIASGDTSESHESFASMDTKITSLCSAPSVQATKDILETITKETIGAKAVKSDDAAVPVHLWNIPILKDYLAEGEAAVESRRKALDGFRKFGLIIFRRALLQDCLARLRRKFGQAWSLMVKATSSGKLTRVGKELAAMRNLLWHATHTSWFEYEAGSRVYHFRFPLRYQTIARDGVPIYFEQPGPSVMKPQPEFKDPKVRDICKEKIEKVIKRRYMSKVTTGLKLRSLIKYFAVPKGEDDVRMVYDGTASGLNDAVWAPSFWLPTVESLVRALDSNSWMADRDIGEMFLNFQLHESAWPFAGVDIRPILDEEGKCTMDRWYVWVRNAMGFKSSPYNSVKMTLIAEEVILGDRLDSSNPFQWESVRLNLPGTSNYDPTCSWIAKVRVDGLNACILVTFVDDERVAGATRELTWQAGHRLAQIQSYLGIQDAARKVGECLQQPRAWAGSVVHIIPGSGVYVLTSEEKWKRMKEIVAKWLTRLDTGAESLAHKEFISDRGFLVYATQAYPDMKPYLKGFHLTAEMWRGNRDEEGWKLPVVDSGASSFLEGDEDESAFGHATKTSQPLYAPKDGRTPPAPRLIEDLKALQELTQFEAPPMRVVRPKRMVHVFYGFADASGKGKGSSYQGYKTVQHPSGKLGPVNEVVYRVGIWGCDEESESSNYREFTNLVDDTEAEARSGNLHETELFLFTDNSTAESAFYKGSSSSKLLHALVLRLHKLSMEFQVKIHLIHVSGKRMIAQGTDGCSRGILMEGVMAGQSMLSFLDLDKSAVERCPALLDWIRDWTMQPELKPLTPEEWFVEGHGIVGGKPDNHGVWMPTHEPSGKLHLWTPAPAVADAMLEELLKARHKRTDTFHVVAIPRLMAPRWRRLFFKVVDLHFDVPSGASFWPSDMHEPVWVGVVLPFVSYRPWSLKRAPLLVELAGTLRQVCKERDVVARNILRKLLKLPRRVDSVSASVASGMLHMPGSGHLSERSHS